MYGLKERKAVKTARNPRSATRRGEKMKHNGQTKSDDFISVDAAKENLSHVEVYATEVTEMEIL